MPHEGLVSHGQCEDGAEMPQTQMDTLRIAKRLTPARTPTRRGQRQALLSPQKEGRSQPGNSKGFPPLLHRYEPRQDCRET
jgi:hypothetical protein